MSVEAHPFLSDAWIAAARSIREEHDEAPPVAVEIRMNQVITDVPFGEGTVHSYMDTSSGALVLELGELDDPDVTITTDYLTAKAIFVDQDPAVAMQAFMSGKIRVQGDMMKLLALQTVAPSDPGARDVAEKIRTITAA